MFRSIFLSLMFLLVSNRHTEIPDSKRASDARAIVWPGLKKKLSEQGFDASYRVYLRIIKQNDLLEVWFQKGRKYELFKRYNICFYSGGLGTKTKAGDGKSPEGFYTIEPKQLHPSSNYHLAVNIGYPNKLEAANGYTGDAIMIHGRCMSIGCYAMTNPTIEEIYTLLYKAFEAGQQKIDLSIFPFRMSDEHLDEFSRSPYRAFWQSLKPGYDLFEKNHIPPVVGVINKRYVFSRQ